MKFLDDLVFHKGVYYQADKPDTVDYEVYDLFRPDVKDEIGLVPFAHWNSKGAGSGLCNVTDYSETEASKYLASTRDLFASEQLYSVKEESEIEGKKYTHVVRKALVGQSSNVATDYELWFDENGYLYKRREEKDGVVKEMIYTWNTKDFVDASEFAFDSTKQTGCANQDVYSVPTSVQCSPTYSSTSSSQDLNEISEAVSNGAIVALVIINCVVLALLTII